MRDKPSKDMEERRVKRGIYSTSEKDGMRGVFVLYCPDTGKDLLCISSGADSELNGGWEHVSVSRIGSNRPPIWDEICFVKDMFWDENECVVQFHPKKSDYVNLHPGVLHLWKKVDGES